MKARHPGNPHSNALETVTLRADLEPGSTSSAGCVASWLKLACSPARPKGYRRCSHHHRSVCAAIETWSLQFLALPMAAVGAVDLYTTVSSRERRAHASSYATACLAIAGALLLFVSPSFVATSVVAILILLLAADGLLKLGHAVIARESAPPGIIVINGVANLFIALVGWWLWRKVNLEIAVGVAIAGYTAGAGWRMLV